jgi:Fic family protein
MSNQLPFLPPQFDGKKIDLETKEIMREASKANRKLAELKGYSEIVPNKNILINAITLNEAKESSEIENIITTHDELFSALSRSEFLFGAAKEILNYKQALWRGIDLIRKNGFLTTNMLVEIQEIIEGNKAGVRKQGGTRLINERTGEVIYTPPETEAEIRNLLGNLEQYINEEDEIDALIKLAVIHYQFESIHPFYDGNGRTGRIINELFLVMRGLLDSPILYLSKYILSTKEDYYRLLNDIHNKGNWEEWILYILKGIQETSEKSLNILRKINKLIENTSNEIRKKHPKIYSKELVDILFVEFYTRIKNVETGLSVTRKTASNYLNELSQSGILEVEVRGKDKLFINKRLLEIMKRM